MRVNVSELLKEPVGSLRRYQIDEAVEIVEGNGNCPVRGEVELMHTDRSILVKGTLKTEPAIICSRCLVSFTCPLILHLEDEYFPTLDVTTGAALPVPDEPNSFTIDAQHILDADEAIRQSAVIATPMKPLCSDNCAGLCPTCGCNLNLKQCNCPSQSMDPRWLKLTELVNGQKGTE
ncbi:DUF177 domain-containing protein [Chloroflexota bacterium]